MKTLTTLLLTILIFTAAKCQQPDVECYSIGYVDSIKADYQLRIDILSSVLQSNTFETNEDSCILISDDGNIRAEIIKEGSNIWVNVIHGAKRIDANYFNGSRSIMLMDSTYTVGSLYIK